MPETQKLNEARVSSRKAVEPLRSMLKVLALRILRSPIIQVVADLLRRGLGSEVHYVACHSVDTGRRSLRGTGGPSAFLACETLLTYNGVG